jgi:hypothetical protein
MTGPTHTAGTLEFAMSHQLEIELLRDDGCPPETHCVCCESLCSADAACVLYDGPSLLGHLCQECFQRGPRRAGFRFRGRAADMNTAIEKAREALPPGPWAKLKEAIRRDVKRLEDLAETLELMCSWPIREPALYELSVP